MMPDQRFSEPDLEIVGCCRRLCDEPASWPTPKGAKFRFGVGALIAPDHSSAGEPSE